MTKHYETSRLKLENLILIKKERVALSFSEKYA